MPLQSDVVSPPGKTIREILKYRKISRLAFAEALHYSESSVYRLLNGQMRISPALALLLEKVLDVPVDFWLRCEAAYSKYLGRSFTSLDIERTFADAMTIQDELAKLGDEAVQQLYTQAEGKMEITCRLCERQVPVSETRPKLISPRTVREAVHNILFDATVKVEMALCCLECCKRL